VDPAEGTRYIVLFYQIIGALVTRVITSTLAIDDGFATPLTVF